MTTPRTFAVLLLAFSATLVAVAADKKSDKSEKKSDKPSDISFKSRSDDEKRFIERVGKAVVKAAHFTARKPTLVKYEYTSPKPNRTELVLKVEYQGAVSGKVTGKKYVADVTIKIDSTDKKNWEVLNIEYHDNNNVNPSYRKLQELIKEMNR